MFKNKGGAEQVKIVDRAAFHGFPKCERAEHLPSYLGLWEQLRRKHGQTLPDELLKPMVLNVLPKDVAADVRRNCRGSTRRLPTTDYILVYLRQDYHRLTDE